jgi:hypothetical protein
MSNKRSKPDYFVRSALKEVSLLRKHFNVRGQGDDVGVTREISPAVI